MIIPRRRPLRWCDMPLPDGWKGEGMETKDFDCELAEHVITKDGRLAHDPGFHGVVNFYGTDSEGDWHEYNAKFTDGQLVGITQVVDDG